MHKAYKFCLYPSNEQPFLLIKTMGYCRYVFNRVLGD
ncbi:helix-turn-helix domain-containing protein [Priestia abyssalis]|nr:helix-turn-helix domain-containing protein [Priestia abyssalis]